MLEQEVLTGLRERLMDPSLYATFATEFTAEWNRLQGTADADRSSWLGEIKRIDSQLSRLVDAIAEGHASASIMDRVTHLEQSKRAVEQKLQATPMTAPRLHSLLPQLYRQKVAALIDRLGIDGELVTLEPLRTLIDEIRLVPEEGRLRIEVRGELSSILALAGDAENAKREYHLTVITSSGRRGNIEVHGVGNDNWCLVARQVKLVAGTRNCLDLLLTG